MTRINVGIAPSLLSAKHLLAEHREIKRIPNAVRKGKVNLQNIPSVFTLGKGHVRFFYNKLGFLKQRYISLRDECRNRGFNVTDYENSFDSLPVDLMGNYNPTLKDKQIVEERIAQKLKKK